MRGEAKRTEVVLKALAEPRRIRMLEVLRADGPLPVGELARKVEVSQQAVSQHLAVLEEAGVVEARREGTRHLYMIRPSGFRPVEEFVAGFWNERLEQLRNAVDKS